MSSSARWFLPVVLGAALLAAILTLSRRRRPRDAFTSVYMGHSYFRRQAEAMEEYAEIAGIDDHRSVTQSYGGYNGSAYAIWNNDSAPDSRTTIQKHLDSGVVRMFGMTIFIEDGVPETDGRHINNQLLGLQNWIAYAKEKNPDVVVFVALPWLGRPLEYVGDTGNPQTSGHEAYRAKIAESESVVKSSIIDVLRSSFPETEIFLLAYGQGAAELRELYNTGQLSDDVDTLVSQGERLGIHKDEHGHAEQMLTDLNTLIWLESIYNYDVTKFATIFPYTIDIKQIAHDIVASQDPVYRRQFESSNT